MESILILGAAAFGAIALGKKKRRGSRGGAKGLTTVQQVAPDASLLNPVEAISAIGIPKPDFPEMVFGIPFGAGVAAPTWPTITNHKKKFVISYRTVSGATAGIGSRRFMAYRGDSKYHVGVDLYANQGDPVIATQAGIVVNIYHFYHDTYSIFLQCDSGLVINYGELQNGSWKEFGISKGARVKRGQALGRVGRMTGGSSMLHFETYMPPTEKNKAYYGGSTGPILNPTYYLLLSAHIAQSNGRLYAGVGASCASRFALSVPPAQDLEAIAEEEKLVGEQSEDSVLAELSVNQFRPPGVDQADGP